MNMIKLTFLSANGIKDLYLNPDFIKAIESEKDFSIISVLFIADDSRFNRTYKVKETPEEIFYKVKQLNGFL